jgi:hypothetical protein
MIRDNTRLTADQVEELARKIAAAHADALYAHLTEEKPAGGSRAARPRGKRGLRGAERRRSLEMHRGAAGARMEV